MTLYEKFLSLFKKKDLQTVGFNPKGAKISQSVNIDELDNDHNWIVTKIHQYKSDLGEYADYDLAAYTKNGKVKAKLRYLGEQVLLLTEYDRLSFDEGLYDVVTHPDISMMVDDDEINLHEEYRRPRMRGEYRVSVLTLEDKDNNKVVDENETTTSSLRLWDYERNTLEEGISVKQYLFVELDQTNTFALYRGKELNSSKITFY